MRTLVALAALVALPAAASTWEIDPNHTESSFVVKHLMVSNVRGQFGKTTGTVIRDDKDITKSSADVTIDATTVDTRVAKRDAHLKSADFFDVEKYPTITFKTTKIIQGTATEEDLRRLESLCDLVRHTSLCGLGQTAPNPVLSTLRYFRQEYEARLRHPDANGPPITRPALSPQTNA